MAWFNRKIAITGLVSGLVGCSVITGPSEFGDVSVVADLRPDNSLSVTIHNGSSRTILRRVGGFGGCGNELESYDGGKWRYDPTRPFGFIIYCIAIAYPPAPIEPGEAYVAEWAGQDMESWLPGDYRFNAHLTDKDGRALPEKNRLSNTFRIEQ